MVGLGSGIENGDVGFGRICDGVVTPSQFITERNPRNRFKPRLQAKGLSSLSNIPEINRRNNRLIDSNKRITDLKMEQGTGGNSLPIETELPAIARLQFPPSTTITTNVNAVRRDSICSNASSFYYR